MTKRLTALLAAATLATGLATAAHADETISIKVGYMMLSPSGQFASTNNNIIGTRINMENDLNFDNSNQPTGEIAISLGDSVVSFGFIPIDFSGTGVLTRNINFSGHNFTAGTTATSSFKADIFDFGYTHYLVNMDDLPSRLQIGIEASVKTISAKTNMTSAGVNASRSATVPIPTLGLRGRVALADFIGLTGRVGYLGYSGNRFLDADAQIEFSPLPTLGLYAGYRHLNLKIDSNSVFADVTMQGPYAGAFFRF